MNNFNKHILNKAIYVVLLIMFFSHYLYSQELYINEVLVSPLSDFENTANANSMYSDDNPPDNQEWIELYNPNLCNSIDISCYTICGNMNDESMMGSASNWGAFTFPQGTIIPAGGLMVLGGNNAMVPRLDYNITNYYRNFYGVNYLDGTTDRWFLRNDYGWLAIFAPDDRVVDAVYWSKTDGAASLYTKDVFANIVTTRTTCNGQKTYPSARNIPGIEFIGSPIDPSYTSFQRKQDGGIVWYSAPQFPTPNDLNGEPIEAPVFTFTKVSPHCNQNNGSITVKVVHGGPGPYNYTWNTNPPQYNDTAINLAPGTYSVTVSDLFSCQETSGSVTITAIPIHNVSIQNITAENCSNANGSAIAIVSSGKPPFTYKWNSSPIQTNSTLVSVHSGTYFLTVTDSIGCNVVSEVNIPLIRPNPTFITTPDTCNKGVGSISISVSGGLPPYSFMWNNYIGYTASRNDTLHSGKYIIYVSDTVCTVSDTIVINTTPNPIIDFIATPNPLYISSGICDFNVVNNDAVLWYWDFGDDSYSNISNPSHKYYEIGSFPVTLIAADRNGCIDTTIKTIIVKDLTEIYMPNAFTPNGDYINDIFLPKGINVTEFEMKIFSRWGILVFETTDFSKGWDGEEAPNGLYIWIIKYNKDIGGNSYEKKEEIGSVYLHRN